RRIVRRVDRLVGRKIDVQTHPRASKLVSVGPRHPNSPSPNDHALRRWGPGNRGPRSAVVPPTSAAAACSRIRLLSGQYDVHRPTPPYMGAGAAKVSEDGCILATDVFQGVGEDSEAGNVQFA